MTKIRERIMDVAEKVIDCGGRPAEAPSRPNVYPLTAFVVMKHGRWREAPETYQSYGCNDAVHHSIYWNIEEARSHMVEGDWLIEYVPIARYRCRTDKCTDCEP